jgi:HD superfamily phosphohydrolase
VRKHENFLYDTKNIWPNSTKDFRYKKINENFDILKIWIAKNTVKKIELEILKIIEDSLKARQMNADRAREIAKYILSSLHPHMTLNQIQDVVQNFDDHFSELVPIVLEVSRDYEEKVKNAVANHVGTLLKQGKIEEANVLLKKAANKEVKLKE